jgi:hypothetical protein
MLPLGLGTPAHLVHRRQGPLNLGSKAPPALHSPCSCRCSEPTQYRLRLNPRLLRNLRRLEKEVHLLNQVGGQVY